MHTIGLLRHQGSQKNSKRPIKVMEAKSKAKHYQKSKFYTFFICLGSFGGNCLEINFGLNSKVIKVKKAATTGQNYKSQRCNFMGSIWSSHITSNKYKCPTSNLAWDHLKWQFLSPKCVSEGWKLDPSKKWDKVASMQCFIAIIL